MPLDRAVRDLVEARTGLRPTGPIRLLTMLRHFGVAMNPVSFFYAFGAADTGPETIVAEVHNTPWNERHCYVLDGRGRPAAGRALDFREAKAFHVSPFMDLAMDYRFRFSSPGRSLVVHIENHAPNGRFFDATLSLERREIDGRSLAAALVRHPFLTAGVLAGIYGHALRLWWKGVPYHPHPRDLERARRAGPTAPPVRSAPLRRTP